MKSKFQHHFDETYITSSEIAAYLKITRPALGRAFERGILPEPIVVAGTRTRLWVRSEVMENLNKWKFSIQIRRGELNV